MSFRPKHSLPPRKGTRSGGTCCFPARRQSSSLKIKRALAAIHFYEPQMNSACGKSGLDRRTKPVIAADTTCSVSLLTATISGSNFAIP
jgi:hypothetical protein